MFGALLTCLIALLSIATIGAGGWGLYKILQDIRLLFLLDEG
jgi:hypothetical protein